MSAICLQRVSVSLNSKGLQCPIKNEFKNSENIIFSLISKSFKIQIDKFLVRKEHSFERKIKSGGNLTNRVHNMQNFS